MTATCRVVPAGAARRDDAAAAAALGMADWLGLMAAPAFALMALLTGVSGGDRMETLCSVAHGSPLAGMASMYLLMSAVHLAPWLRLVSRR